MYQAVPSNMSFVPVHNDNEVGRYNILIINLAVSEANSKFPHILELFSFLYACRAVTKETTLGKRGENQPIVNLGLRSTQAMPKLMEYLSSRLLSGNVTYTWVNHIFFQTDNSKHLQIQ